MEVARSKRDSSSTDGKNERHPHPFPIMTYNTCQISQSPDLPGQVLHVSSLLFPHHSGFGRKDSEEQSQWLIEPVCRFSQRAERCGEEKQLCGPFAPPPFLVAHSKQGEREVFTHTCIMLGFPAIFLNPCRSIPNYQQTIIP